MHRFAGAVLVAAFAPAVIAAAPVARVPYVSGPVTITTCSVNEDVRNGTVAPFSLHIGYYVNPSDRRPTTITFRVRYGRKSVTVTDGGTYYFNRTYGLQYGAFGGVKWAGSTPDCRVVGATFTGAKALSAGDASDPPAAPAGSPTPAASLEPGAGVPAPVPSGT